MATAVAMFHALEVAPLVHVAVCVHVEPPPMLHALNPVPVVCRSVGPSVHAWQPAARPAQAQSTASAIRPPQPSTASASNIYKPSHPCAIHTLAHCMGCYRGGPAAGGGGFHGQEPRPCGRPSCISPEYTSPFESFTVVCSRTCSTVGAAGSVFAAVSCPHLLQKV